MDWSKYIGNVIQSPNCFYSILATMLVTLFHYFWILFSYILGFFHSNNIGKDRWCQWVIIFWKILFQIFWNFFSNYFGIDNSFKIEIFQLFWISQMALGSKWLLPLPLPLLKRDMQKRSLRCSRLKRRECKYFQIVPRLP